MPVRRVSSSSAVLSAGSSRSSHLTLPDKTVYIVTPELGRTVFHATLVEILRRPRILHTHHSSYPLSLQAVYQADSLNWDMGMCPAGGIAPGKL